MFENWRKNFCRRKKCFQLTLLCLCIFSFFCIGASLNFSFIYFVFCVSKDWICWRRRSSPSCAKWTIFKSSYSRSRGNSNAGSLSPQVLNQKKSPILYLWFSIRISLPSQHVIWLSKIADNCDVQDLCKFNLVRANIQFALNKQWELCKQGYQVAAINSMRWIISG